ncbi:MAG TPA: hypothetical protein ACFYED_01605 [Candidatus Tripitaka californicus]|uniref:hypothetical protein n=1 Tax=Candidatus Tripitaka californicus TaxID=3367616 RepID=UPI0040281C1F|nr:hypothetical protein [Planctomycetota bacterium]
MKTKKKFDAMKTMRKIRDKLSKEFVGMSYEEQKRYIGKRAKVRPKTTQKM